jgi:putative membrane protein
MELITVRRSLVVIALSAPFSTFAIAGAANQGAQAGQANQGAQAGQGAGFDADAYAVVSDPQIAGILRIASENEIDTSQLAATRAQTPEVKTFAVKLSQDHTALAKEADQLLNKQGIQAEDSQDSLSLRAQGVRDMATLRLTPDGASFDREFVKEQVDGHQQLLDLIDATLLPSAHNEELKGFVQRLRMGVVDHLDTAKKLQATLGAQQ